MNRKSTGTILILSTFIIIQAAICFGSINGLHSGVEDIMPESNSNSWEAPSVEKNKEEESQPESSSEENQDESRLPENSFVVSSGVDVSGLMGIAERLEAFPGIRRAVSAAVTTILSVISRDSRGPALLKAVQKPVMTFLNNLTENIDNALRMLGPLAPSIMTGSGNNVPEFVETEKISKEEKKEYLNTLENLQTPQQIVDFLNGEIDGDKTEYVLTAHNVLFGDPEQLFFSRKAVCTGFSRFAQEALESMPEGNEPYETKLIVETYDDLSVPHIMLAYREPETGKWGFLSPWEDHSPETIEDAGISPDGPRAIVEYISSELGGRERITFLTDNTFRIFDQSFTIDEEENIRKENFLETLLGRFTA